MYDENLIHYWGLKSAIETAVEEAVGGKQVEIAKKIITLGLDNETIAQGTGLTVEQIEQLRKNFANL